MIETRTKKVLLHRVESWCLNELDATSKRNGRRTFQRYLSILNFKKTTDRAYGSLVEHLHWLTDEALSYHPYQNESPSSYFRFSSSVKPAVLGRSQSRILGCRLMPFKTVLSQSKAGASAFSIKRRNIQRKASIGCNRKAEVS